MALAPTSTTAMGRGASTGAGAGGTTDCKNLFRGLAKISLMSFFHIEDPCAHLVTIG